MGTGIPKATAPAPTPPSQLLGGAVEIRRVEGLPAAQNMYPSIPGVAPSDVFILVMKMRTLRVGAAMGGSCG